MATKYSCSYAVVVGRNYSMGEYVNDWEWASPPWHMFFLVMLGIPWVLPFFLMPPPPVPRYVPGQPYFIIRLDGVDHWMLTNEAAYQSIPDGTRLIVDYEPKSDGRIRIIHSRVG